MTTEHVVHPNDGTCPIVLTPQSAGWRFLSFQVIRLGGGQTITLETAGVESCVVPLAGAGKILLDGETYPFSRRDVFTEMPSIVYAPPGPHMVLEAVTPLEVAVGQAPADGRHPARSFGPADMRVEIRGTGCTSRQVNHVLAHPLPAERLIVYEAYVPRGNWAGWPPHCHDATHGSPYLEETYYFRYDRPNGFGYHRNYWLAREPDEVFVPRSGDCVLIPSGFHVTTASPTDNMWILNFLAGELVGDKRSTPPYLDPEYEHLPVPPGTRDSDRAFPW